MDYLALLIPLAYLAVLIGSLATFSSLYRRRKIQTKLSLAPYFAPHTARNLYMSLLAYDTPKPPDSVIRSALLLRAVEDIQRILEIRTRKAALAPLLAKGVVGDDIWQRLLRAEAEMEDEVKDVVAEANAFNPGWGQWIFQSANEMASNKILRTKLEAIRADVPAETAWWSATRADARRELEGGVVKKQDAAAVAAPVVEVAHDGKAAAPTIARGVGSDDDAVLVDAPGATSTPGSAKNKKKKGKK